MRYKAQMLEAICKNDTDRIEAIKRLNNPTEYCFGYDESIDEINALFGINYDDPYSWKGRDFHRERW